MFVFIREHHLGNIKIKFILILLLNVTDILLTFFLLDTGYYVEGNPFMVKVVDHHLLGIFVKVVLPALLLKYLFVRMQKATERQLIVSNYLINGLLLVYGFINLFHILMLVILPVLMFMVRYL